MNRYNFNHTYIESLSDLLNTGYNEEDTKGKIPYGELKSPRIEKENERSANFDARQSHYKRKEKEIDKSLSMHGRI